MPRPTSQTPEHPSGWGPQRALATMSGFQAALHSHLTYLELLFKEGSGNRVSWESSPPSAPARNPSRWGLRGGRSLQVLLCSRPFGWVTQSTLTPSQWMRLPNACIPLWATFQGWFVKSNLLSQPRWAGQLSSPNRAPRAGHCLRDLQWMTSWLGSASAASRSSVAAARLSVAVASFYLIL